MCVCLCVCKFIYIYMRPLASCQPFPFQGRVHKWTFNFIPKYNNGKKKKSIFFQQHKNSLFIPLFFNLNFKFQIGKNMTALLFIDRQILL